jgi:hypothetical protein
MGTPQLPDTSHGDDLGDPDLVMALWRLEHEARMLTN